MNDEKWIMLSDAANRHRTKSAVSYFRSNGLDPILLKGWSISRFYDPKLVRTYTDVDLAFDPGDESRVLDLWRSFTEKGTSIDVHYGLRHLDLLPWDDIFSRSYCVDLENVPVRVLLDEDNLRSTAVHWLTDGGINKEKLLDVYYLVKNRRPDFDWDRCLDANGPVRRNWVIVAVATAREYLGLDVAGLPADMQKMELPHWYTRTIENEWRHGPYRRMQLRLAIRKPRVLWEQIRRRFPPNPVAATIMTEEPFRDGDRAPNQVRYLFQRALRGRTT